jgi:hypothetical protein
MDSSITTNTLKIVPTILVLMMDLVKSVTTNVKLVPILMVVLPVLKMLTELTHLNVDVKMDTMMMEKRFVDLATKLAKNALVLRSIIVFLQED